MCEKVLTIRFQIKFPKASDWIKLVKLFSFTLSSFLILILEILLSKVFLYCFYLICSYIFLNNLLSIEISSLIGTSGKTVGLGVHISKSSGTRVSLGNKSSQL